MGQEGDFLRNAGVQPLDADVAPDEMRLFSLGQIELRHNEIVKPLDRNMHVRMFCKSITKRVIVVESAWFLKTGEALHG